MPEHVSLFYARTFDDEWVLLICRASNKVYGALRTAGGCYLCDHPLSREGFQEDQWRWAEWHGVYDGERFTGTWKGW